jgi:putative transposase
MRWGVSLIDPGGWLSGLTKTVVESALDAELTEHLVCDPGTTDRY